jgi:hypothetical protein
MHNHQVVERPVTGRDVILNEAFLLTIEVKPPLLTPEDVSLLQEEGPAGPNEPVTVNQGQKFYQSRFPCAIVAD